MTQDEVEKKVDILMQRFEEVNAFFIAKIAEQVSQIGKLIPSSMNRLVIMAQMNSDMAEINQKIAEALKLTIPDLYDMYNDVLQSHYGDFRFVRALQEKPLTDSAKARIRHFTEAISRQTVGTVINLSNTTIASQVYRHTIDHAVLAVSSGLTDYQAAVRQSIRDLGYNGLQMQYPSGYHRRLDTAIRQNIIDGANQIAQQGSILMGKELGYDAYEISAHLRSAPDHEPIQGRVFLIKEFERLQTQQTFEDVDGNHYEAIKRPIGEWNCMHIAMAFSTKYSKRQYTDAQLKKWADDNEKGCMIGGKHYTTYKAAQLMRQIETQIRREKDTANAARIVGDGILRRECQGRINALARKYQEVVQASGLKARKERMSVEGFRMVKV